MLLPAVGIVKNAQRQYHIGVILLPLCAGTKAVTRCASVAVRLRDLDCFSHLCIITRVNFNPLKAELNPICHLLALLRAHPIFHVSRIRVNLLVVCFLLGNSPASEFYMPTFRNTLFHLHRKAYEDGTNSVPKRRHINFRRRGITQKKTYNIQNTAKV